MYQKKRQIIKWLGNPVCQKSFEIGATVFGAKSKIQKILQQKGKKSWFLKYPKKNYYFWELKNSLGSSSYTTRNI